MKLRAGISPCPNDLFIFAGLISGKVKTAWDWEFLFEDVESLNRRARSGVCDLIKISYANALNCPGYRLLECGGALGRECGPLLLTGGAPWNADAEVLVPGAFTTANFLLDFWAGRPLRKQFLPFDTLYRELRAKPDAQGVVIHEKRFTFKADGLNLVEDLGRHWEQQTGHPIPLGTLIYRSSPHLPAAANVEAAVRSSLEWSRHNEPVALALCAQHSQDMRPEIMRAHIDLYVNGFTENLGPEGRAAVDFFLQKLRKFRPESSDS